MANTYIKIAQLTPSGVSSATFSSIPNTYTDLVILMSVRSAGTASNYGTFLLFRLNGSSANIDQIRFEGYATSLTTTTDTNGGFGRATNANQLADSFSNNMMYVANYAGGANKCIWNESSTPTDSNLYNIHYWYGSSWNNNTAINSIEIYTTDGSNFVSGSNLTLYGISKS